MNILPLLLDAYHPLSKRRILWIIQRNLKVSVGFVVLPERLHVFLPEGPSTLGRPSGFKFEPHSLELIDLPLRQGGFPNSCVLLTKSLADGVVPRLQGWVLGIRGRKTAVAMKFIKVPKFLQSCLKDIGPVGTPSFPSKSEVFEFLNSFVC